MATLPRPTPARSTSRAPIRRPSCPPSYTFTGGRQRQPQLQRHAQDRRRAVDHARPTRPTARSSAARPTSRSPRPRWPRSRSPIRPRPVTPTPSASRPRTPTATRPRPTPGRSTSRAPTPRPCCPPTTPSPVPGWATTTAATPSVPPSRRPASSRSSATDTADGSINGSQTAITVTPAATSTLVVAGFTDPTTAGDTHSFSVTAKDAYGNTTPAYTGTVHVTSTDGQAVLPADYAFTGAGLGNDNGSHTFSATLKTAGEQSITATDTADRLDQRQPDRDHRHPGRDLDPASSRASPIRPRPVDTHSFSVTAKDAYGNTTPAYTGTVHFTSTDAQAVLPADYAFTGAGLATTTAATPSAPPSRRPASSRSARPTRPTARSTAARPRSPSPRPRPRPVVAGFTDPTTAGDSHTLHASRPRTPTATPTPAYTGTVHFTSSDAQAVLPADYTFTGRLTHGSHTFSATLKTAGEQSITATDTADGSITGSQTAITVTPAATTTLVVAGFTDPTTAGDSHSFTVTAKDAYGNTTPAYTGTVHVTSSDAQAVLPADYAFTGRRRQRQPHLQRHPQDRRRAVDHRHRHGRRLDHRQPDRDHRHPGRGHALVVAGSPIRPSPAPATPSRSRPRTPSATRPRPTLGRSTSRAPTCPGRPAGRLHLHRR